jgi:hypothetical protein
MEPTTAPSSDPAPSRLGAENTARSANGTDSPQAASDWELGADGPDNGASARLRLIHHQPNFRFTCGPGSGQQTSSANRVAGLIGCLPGTGTPVHRLLRGKEF